MTDSEKSIRRRTYVQLAGGAVAGVTSLAGCTALPGSGGGSESFTIGGTIPLTGQFSSLGKDMRRGYRLGVTRMRQSDAFDQDIELLLENDESDEQTLRNRLQQLVSNNSVDMIWGSFSSLLVTAGSSFAEQQELLFIGTAFAYEAPHRDQSYEWTYAAMPKSRDIARSTRGVLERIPKHKRPRRVGLWEPDSGWGAEQADYWEQTLGDAGYDIALRKTFSIGSQDFSSLISQSKSAGVEVLLSTPTPPGGITAMNQMRSSNFVPKVLKFVRAADPQAWWSALGQDGAYALMCPGWVPGLTGGGNQRLQQLADRSGGSGGSSNASATATDTNGSTDASGNESTGGSGSVTGLLPVMVGSSYNVTQVAQQAIAAAESTEPDAIQNALRSETFQTVIGEFGFRTMVFR